MCSTIALNITDSCYHGITYAQLVFNSRLQQTTTNNKRSQRLWLTIVHSKHFYVRTILLLIEICQTISEKNLLVYPFFR